MKDTFTIRRHKRSLERVERRLEKIRQRLDALLAKKESHQIEGAAYTRKKSALDDRFRRLSARERSLRGSIAQERAKVTRRTRATAAR